MYRVPLFVAAIAAIVAFGAPRIASAAGGDTPQQQSDGSTTLECDSSSNAQHRCAAPGWMGARLVHQLSHAPCIEGETWGFDQGDPAVWVAKGCRAQFVLLREVDYRRTAPTGDVVECASTNGEMKKCRIPSSWQGVRIVKQLSHSACAPARDFGYDHRGTMWVDHGCRGRFANDSSD